MCVLKKNEREHHSESGPGEAQLRRRRDPCAAREHTLLPPPAASPAETTHAGLSAEPCAPRKGHKCAQSFLPARRLDLSAGDGWANAPLCPPVSLLRLLNVPNTNRNEKWAHHARVAALSLHISKKPPRSGRWQRKYSQKGRVYRDYLEAVADILFENQFYTRE